MWNFTEIIRIIQLNYVESMQEGEDHEEACSNYRNDSPRRCEVITHQSCFPSVQFRFVVLIHTLAQLGIVEIGDKCVNVKPVEEH